MALPLVRNYARPASLGGESPRDPDVVELRWFGTACFELAFADRVLLLDNYYDRPHGYRPLGFSAADVTRADLILVGHPHFDHISDVARVSRQTGAKAIVPELGVDVLLHEGMPSERIEAVNGRGSGELFEYSGYSVRVLRGSHMNFNLTPEQADLWLAFRRARSAIEQALGAAPANRQQFAEAQAIYGRGVHTPEILTEGTMTYVIDIEGFTIVYRDSGGAITPEEQAYFAERPGCDVAIIALNGSPMAAGQLEQIFMPLVRLYEPRIVVPTHHDELWTAMPDPDGEGGTIQKVFDNHSSESIKERIHDEIPSIVTPTPGALEPLVIHRATRHVRLGEVAIV